MENRRVALVTGASRGIGRAIATRLASSNIDIVINYNKDLEGAEETQKQCEKIGVKTRILQGDMGKEEDVNLIFENIVDEFGKIDILINNAGITIDGLLISMKEEAFREVLEVNLFSAFYTMKLAARIMAKNRFGRIINISSIVGIRGNAGQVNYSASKAGLIGMTKSLAKEMAKRNIRVNAIAPGFIETDMTHKLSNNIKNKMLEEIPVGYFGKPEDIGNLVNFLVSEEANYITGQVISIDGGMNI
ncbi:MAG: 3-oxoacyl-[acyl-carrier-protein] reductase [Tissierellia bacterium]|nr:3-oxoacyl-[acyl-carrier-protein] reductase [Tissierellia bacterium]